MEQLRGLGPLTPTQAGVTASVGATVALWVSGAQPVTSALFGLAALLAVGALKWAECLKLGSAWDTFLWFGAIMSLAAGLKTSG